jgi:hypothetical protein
VIELLEDEKKLVLLDCAEKKNSRLADAAMFLSKAVHWLALGQKDFALDSEHKAAELLERVRYEHGQCTCNLRVFFGGGVHCKQHGRYR